MSLGDKIAVVGSRDGIDLDAVREFIDHLNPDINVVISGGARGVDTAAVDRATERGIPVEVFPADWDRYGRSAGYKRNKDIVRAADSVAAFWDGISRGTEHTIKLAIEAGKPVAIFGVAGDLIRWVTPNTGA